MKEVSVAVTDFIVSMQALWYGYVLYRRYGVTSMAGAYIVFFLGLSLSTLFGGVYHWLEGEASGQLDAFLWWMTIVFAGCASYGLYLASIKIFIGYDLHKRWKWILLGILLLYVLVVTFWKNDFYMVLLFYLPATLITICSFIYLYVMKTDVYFLIGGLGLAISLIAGLMQQLKIEVDPIYLNYNSLYHLLLMLALAFFYCGVGRLLKSGEARKV